MEKNQCAISDSINPVSQSLKSLMSGDNPNGIRIETLKYDFVPQSGANVLQVVNWRESFETRGTQNFKCKSNFVLPRKQGIGYRLLLRKPNGPELYGAWCALILVLSGHPTPRDGFLTHDGSPFGKPYSLKEIEVLTYIPEHTYTMLFEACLSPEIAWMSTTSVRERASTQQRPMGHSNTDSNNISNTNTCENRERGDSPETCEEAKVFFREKRLPGGAISGENFFNHYQAQGWVRANGQPVKSWKALARQWSDRGSATTSRTEGPDRKPIMLEDEE